MTRAVAVVPAALPIAEAARLARRRRARLVVARVGKSWGGVTPGVLAQALALGLERAPVDAICWAAAAVPPGMPEVAVRRRLSPDGPFVVVVAGSAAVGAVLWEGGVGPGLPLSGAAALARLDERRGRVLRAAGTLGVEMGIPVAAVGGLVRDLLLEPARGRADLDVMVEGDGPAFARRLARTLGGNVLTHAAFLTATVTLPDGLRVDVATARRERYARPGALPEVEAATLLEDLGRRDFSVNALAIRLDGARWGEVVDPTGGLADLRRHRIRVLHPLSFVEDPTRILRAVRFAVRLDFTLERTTRRLLARAVALPVFDALSGDRLRAELDAVLGEAAGAAILARLGRVGAFRLLAPGYRFPATAAALVHRAAASAASLPLAPESREALVVLALTAHVGPAAAATCATRLGVPAPARAAVARARADASMLLAGLARARGPGEAYRLLRPASEIVAAWAHVRARRASIRQHIGEHLRHWRQLRPLLSGDDLQAMGLRPGPAFGRLLDGVLEEQVAGRVRNREAAAAYVRAALAAARANAVYPDQRGG